MPSQSRTHLPSSLSLLLTVAAATLLAPVPAAACGAMVFQNHEVRPGGMSGQELFLSVMPDATTLVVSASFIDVDGDKAFLLPLSEVPSEVLDGDDSLFIALDNGTTPVVTITDASQREPVSLGCAKSGDAGSREGGNHDVEVLDRGMTATYEYVIVGGDTGTALADWLTGAGFAVPADFTAALDVYANAGWYFFAAKLNETAPEGHIAPLELRLSGSTGPATIPFGIGAFALAPDDAVDLTLYVASPSTLLPGNYAVDTIDRDQLEATSNSSSNYAERFDAIVAAAPTWVVEYSQGQWRPSDLGIWAEGDYELGIGTEQDVDLDWIADFEGRLGYDQARLTRLRTRLSAAELVDLTLVSAGDIDVDRNYDVTWDPDAGGCGVAETGLDDSTLGLLGLFVFGLGGLLRRRASAKRVRGAKG